MSLTEFRADLHCHTTCSDGSLTPEQLMVKAKEVGLSAISITDHDTVDAYAIAIPLAKQLDIQIISGVEFSTDHCGKSVHVLGYAFSLQSAVLKAFCEKHIQRRHQRTQEIIKLLKKFGMSVSEEDVLEAASGKTRLMCRVHIALAMKKKGYVNSVQEAFTRFIAEGQPCFDPGEGVSVEDTLKCIHEAGGKAIIAHPHLIPDKALLNSLLELDFDGLEAYYGRFHLSAIQFWIEMAEKRGWQITGGSDFHGDIRPQNPLGCSWISQELFQPLYSHYLSQ